MNTIVEREPSMADVSASTKGQVQSTTSKALQIQTILVPLDFSRASIEALKYAVMVAADFGANIHLVHVQADDELPAIPRAAGLMLGCRDVMELMQDRHGPMATKHEVHFGMENCHVLTGRPFREICKLADTIAADLIVLPTRGHTGLRHIVLGSTAERVVRFANCPVLVPRGMKFRRAVLDLEEGNFSPRNILVPVDFSECSLAGVNYAALLARRFQARLCLFHAVFPYEHLVTSDRFSGMTVSLIENAREDAVEQMLRLKTMEALDGIECETRIRIGYPV